MENSSRPNVLKRILPRLFRRGESSAPKTSVSSHTFRHSFKWKRLLDSLSSTSSALDPNWINLDEIGHWLRTCDRWHENCQPDPQHCDGWPIWLIDVKEGCIVSAQGGERYFALSYVWGNATSTELRRDNLPDLQRPTSLSSANHVVQIPRTIQHAMRLVELLGERYFWVDRLCICQDDEENKHTQIRAMADIYENAYLTIVASTGWDANQGLRGIQGITEPRQLSSQCPTQGYEQYLDLQNSIWMSRGWTFQEYHFSRRVLIFQYQAISWECQHGGWFESTGTTGQIPGHQRKVILPRLKTHISLRGSDGHGGALRRYSWFVNQFNARSLTYPEDALSAFSGVIDRFQADFTGGFLWGLPVEYFDIALIWQAVHPTARRVPRKLHSTFYLPSWSWLGWEGELSPETWSCLYDSKETEQYIGWKLIQPLCIWAYEESGKIFDVRTRLQGITVQGKGPSPQDPGPYIYTRTSSTTCQVIRKPWDIYNHPDGFTITIGDTNDDSYGYGQVRLIPIPQTNSSVETCRAIALSTAVHRSWMQQGERWGLEQSEKVYIVMWVETVNGISYRKGIDAVQSEIWERCDREVVDIKLG